MIHPVRFRIMLALYAAIIATTTAQTPADVTESPGAVATSNGSDAYLKLPPTETIADTLLARGRFLAAIHVYEQLHPTPEIWNKLGIACEHMRMYDRAQQSFEAALKLNAKYPEAYNNLGTLAHSQGDLKRAEKMYRKALKLKPGAANTLRNLGTLYYAENKFRQGDKAYKQAVAADPQILERSTERGIQASSKVQSASEVHYHLAMTYAQAGSQKLALQYLRQAIGEGFKDRNRLLHDKEFADLRTNEVFLQMMDDLKRN